MISNFHVAHLKVRPFGRLGLEELNPPGLWNSWEIHSLAIILKQAARSLMSVRPSNREGLWTASGGSELSCFFGGIGQRICPFPLPTPHLR